MHVQTSDQPSKLQKLSLSQQRRLHNNCLWIPNKIVLRANNLYGKDSRVSNVMDVSTGTTEPATHISYHLSGMFEIFQQEASTAPLQQFVEYVADIWIYHHALNRRAAGRW